MNYLKELFFVLLAAVVLSSCGKQESVKMEDGYNLGTDSQYYMFVNSSPKPKVQETEDGCVFYHDGFIYSYVHGGNILPLCAKVNCLHDKETDPEKRRDCNACLEYCYDSETNASISLMLYKDAIYAVYTRSDTDLENGDRCLCRTALDGTSKDVLSRMQSIEHPLIHRGYLYYYLVEMTVQLENGVGSDVSLQRINLEKKNSKAETLYHTGDMHGYGDLKAVGKYVYFFMLGQSGTKMVNAVYNIETGEIRETALAANLQPYQNRFYALAWREESQDLDILTDLYETDVFGETKNIVLKDIPQGERISSDGRYFYFNNSRFNELDSETEIVYQVYDSSFRQIDEVCMLDTGEFWSEIPVGGEKYQYLRYDDAESGEWGLYIWDKSSIGTIHGGLCPYSKIPYEKAEGPGKDVSHGKADISDWEPVINYSDITDEYVSDLSSWTEKEQDPKYAVDLRDTVKCEVKLEEGEVSVSYVWRGPQDSGNNGDEIILSRSLTKELILSGFYIMDGNVYERRITVTSTDNAAADEAVLKLPEGAEKFIGVSAMGNFEYTEEHNTKKGMEEGLPSNNSVVNGNVTCRAGRVK